MNTKIIEQLSVCVYTWTEFQIFVFRVLIFNEDLEVITDNGIDELARESKIIFTKAQKKEYRRLMKDIRENLFETCLKTDALVLGEIWRICIRKIKTDYGDNDEGNANLTKLFHNLLEDATKACEDPDTKEVVYLRWANDLKSSKEEIENVRNLCDCRIICDISGCGHIQIISLPCGFNKKAVVH